MESKKVVELGNINRAQRPASRYNLSYLRDLHARVSQSLQQFRAGKLTQEQVVKLRQQYESELREFTEATRERELTPRERELVTEIKKKLAQLDGQPVLEQTPARTPSPAVLPNAQDVLARRQILPVPREPLGRQDHAFNLQGVISFDTILRVFQDSSAAAIEPETPVFRTTPTQRERSSSLGDVLSNLLMRFIIRQLMREVQRVRQATGKVGENEIREAVRKIREQIAELIDRIKTEVRPKERKENRRLPEVAKETEKERVAELVCHIEAEKEEISFSVSGQPIKREALIRMLSRLMVSDPSAVIPLLTEILLEAIQQNLPAQHEIVRALVEAFSLVNTMSAKDQLPAGLKTALPATILPILLNEYQHLLTLNPSAAGKPVIAGDPAVAGRPPILASLETIILEVARLPEARPFILSAMASPAANTKEPVVSQPLVSSAIGQRVITTAVNSMLETVRTGPAVIGNTTLVGNLPVRALLKPAPAPRFSTLDPGARLERIVYLVASENEAKLPETVDAKTAKQVLQSVAQVQKIIQFVGDKRLRQLETASAQAADKTPVPIQSTTLGAKYSPLRPARKMTVSPVRTAAPRQALRELIGTLKESGLTLSKELFEIIGGYYANLAGFSGIKDPAIVQPFMAAQMTEETRQNSILRRLLAVLETQVRQTQKTTQAAPVTRTTRTAAAAEMTAAQLSAEILFYGLVMKRVMADVERADEIITALRRRGKLGSAIQAVKDGNFEAIEAIIGIEFPASVSLAA